MVTRAVAGGVLVLGGTAEARALAVLLQEAGLSFVSSLAGRVSDPRLPVGEVRVGGFGGAAGLASYLRTYGVAAVVDATHPFAATMSAHALSACAEAGVPLLRLARPGWADHPDAEAWHWVEGHDQAATLAGRLGRRVLLTTGRQTLAWYLGPLRAHEVTVRVVEPPEAPLPDRWRLVRDRGPYDVAGERELLAGVEVLVTKDSGGSYTSPKLDAARVLGVAVVVVRRPPVLATASVTTPEQALAWLSRLGTGRGRPGTAG